MKNLTNDHQFFLLRQVDYVVVCECKFEAWLFANVQQVYVHVFYCEFFGILRSRVLLHVQANLIFGDNFIECARRFDYYFCWGYYCLYVCPKCVSSLQWQITNL